MIPAPIRSGDAFARKPRASGDDPGQALAARLGLE